MSLVSDIIVAAYRETNLIPLAAAPTTLQTAEALPLFNTIIMSSIGNEIGDHLNDLNIGGPFDESIFVLGWTPPNARLVLNLTMGRTIFLDPDPVVGQRLAVIDVGNNLATFPVTLNAYGRNIEGSATLVLNTNGDARQWIYRGDSGNWMKLNSLLATDLVPFPVEFDDYFITMLAMRLNPRYGQALSTESAEALKRGRRNLRNRYRGKTEEYPDYVGIIGERRSGSYIVNQFGRGNYRWN